MTDEQNDLGRWWQVRTRDGSVWMETSDEHEARTEAAKPGMSLYNLRVQTTSEWVRITGDNTND